MAEPAAPSEAKALDVIVGLVPELEDEFGSAGTRFFDRLCEALCRLASLERAGLLLYDEARRLVVPVGSHGVDPELLLEIYGTLEETPIAQVALSEDRVVEVSGRARAPRAAALRDLRRRHDLDLHTGLGGGQVARRDLCRPGRWAFLADRGRAPDDVRLRQGGGAGGEYSHRGRAADARSRAVVPPRARPRAARAGRPAPLRGLAGARLRAPADGAGAQALRDRDPGGDRRHADGHLAAADAAVARHRRQPA